MLAETPVTSAYIPCYSAVSSSLTISLPDCSNYLPFCHTHYNQYFTSLFGQDPLSSRFAGDYYYFHCFSALLQNKSGIWEKHSTLRKLNNKQKQVLIFLLPFKMSSQFPFVSFLSISVLSLLPFSILSLLPFLIYASLSTISSFSFDQFFDFLR